MQYVHLFLRSLSGVAIFAAVIAWTPSASAAVYPPRQVLSANAIELFLANPKGLLGEFPNGGAQMIAKVRDLAASDPKTLDGLIGLLKSANPDQASAIGTALGQVALMAISTDQAFATQIQTAVAQAGNVSALTAFSAVVGGDIKLAATGPGAGIGGGGEAQTNASSGFIGGFFGGTVSLNGGARNTPDTFPTPSFSTSTPGTPGSTSVSPF
jgi:hypothetical protein